MSARFTLGVCDYCPQSVIWGNTGKSMMPVDPTPVFGGNVVLVAKTVGPPQIVVTTDPHAYPDQPRYVSHFGSCPHASAVRRPRVKTLLPPQQDETLF